MAVDRFRDAGALDLARLKDDIPIGQDGGWPPAAEALENDPTLVAGVAAAASLAIENERLQAAVRARLALVRESRARLVTKSNRKARAAG